MHQKSTLTHQINQNHRVSLYRGLTGVSEITLKPAMMVLSVEHEACPQDFLDNEIFSTFSIWLHYF